MGDAVLAVLAGGKATRLGGVEKVRLDIGGTSPLERVLRALGPLPEFGEVALLVGTKQPSAFEDAALGFAEAAGKPVCLVADIYPGRGPLSGLHAALRAAAGRPLFLCAGDLPFPSPALARALGERLRAGADVAIARSERGLEPLFAWYGPACLAAVERALERGDERVVSFFGEVRVSEMKTEEAARYADLALTFLNLNTPDDVERARAALASRGEAGSIGEDGE